MGLDWRKRSKARRGVVGGQGDSVFVDGGWRTVWRVDTGGWRAGVDADKRREWVRSEKCVTSFVQLLSYLGSYPARQVSRLG